MKTLQALLARAAVAGLAASAAACATCVPVGSEAAQRGYATTEEFIECAEISSYDPANPADCYQVGDVVWPLTGSLWSRTFWIVSSEDDSSSSSGSSSDP